MKKPHISLITALFVIVMSIPIQHLGASHENGHPPIATKERSSLLQIGGNYTHVNIKPSGLPGLHGNMGGVQGMYEYRPLNFLYLAVKGMWREGNTTGDDAKRSLIDIDAQERLGYTLATKDKRYLFSLFSGIGYRYLSHRLHQNGSVLKLSYNEFYVPVGVLNDFRINTGLSVGVYVTWMPQVNSTVILKPLGGAQWTLKKRLSNFLIELPLDFSLGSKEQFSILFKPFYEYWQDGKSTAVTTTGVPLGIPGNTYNFVGAELNFGYQF